ncbi:FYDLN acid domain-containing protein [Kiloniella sp. EL199]|uniref:FYDLN acid domain-containing protein n=1 Tax=Kiloniella sp. EL199 TaxID=2107581 RepID=UPI000EA10470|nr:FYDLN acid domain-containing protein [Kiloniella sp. EL199]
MSKPEWGSKRTCLSCKAKFYDFKKSPIVCPKCGTELDLTAKSGRPKQSAKAQAEEINEVQDVDLDTSDDVVDFPDEEELLHIDDGDDLDPDDDEDLQSVSSAAGGISDD